MGDVVNLNRWRKTKAKAKAKEEKARQAESNRVAFGRTKAEKQTARQQSEQETTELDGKKLED